MLNREDILKLAELSRLDIENEISSYQKEIPQILKFVEKINELDLQNVEPTNHILDIYNVFREDVPGEPYTQEEILSSTEYKKNGFIKTPKVI